MSDINAWLESFGFIRNPFETTEAGSEANYATDFLHETFVKPEGFDNILGHPLHPKSTIIFAARGRGKTSARLMTAHFCQEGLFTNSTKISQPERIRVLPISHTRFEQILGDVEGESSLVDRHVTEILSRAFPSVINMLIRYDELMNKAKNLDIFARLEWQYFLLISKNYLSFSEFEFARNVFGNEIVSFEDISVENIKQPLGFPLPKVAQSSNEALNQEFKKYLASYVKTGPIDLLKRFVTLASDLGFGAVYVLIDSIDEIPETADDFAFAATLLIPLLSNLNLMTNTPHLAFKVFIPYEMKSLLLGATKKIRRDRLSIQEINLRDQDLGEILNRRLFYCSEGAVTSLDAVCEVALRGKITNILVEYADGNPRHLVLLGQYMLESHCQSLQDDLLLTQADITAAQVRLHNELAEKIPTIEKQNVIVQEPKDTNVQRVSESWFRHELPHPIAFSYLVYERENEANLRIWKLYELIEACLAYLSLILLASLVQRLGSETQTRLKRSGLRLNRTSLGIWRILLEKLPGMLAGNGARNYFARACQRLVEKHGDFLQDINDERNRSAHGGPQREDACSALLTKFAIPLRDFMEDLNFLRKSQLISVRRVEKRNETYLHHCTQYKGDMPIFSTVEISISAPLDSGCLWFLGEDIPVNLQPWILTKKDENLGENVWLYQGIKGDSIIYKNCGTGKMVTDATNHDFVVQVIGK
jgi:hypothetical protein